MSLYSLTHYYPVGTVYHCTCHTSNTIVLVYLKCYVIFQKVRSEPHKHCGFVEPQGCSWGSYYNTRKNTNFKSKLSESTLK